MLWKKRGIWLPQGGPAVWIDIPVNYQGGYIETEELEGYDPREDDAKLPPRVGDDIIKTVLEKIQKSGKASLPCRLWNPPVRWL